MKAQLIPVLSVLAGFTSAAALNTASCTTVNFTVSGSAQNRVLVNLPLNDTAALLQLVQADLFPRVLVSGPSYLVGTYCEPAVRNANGNTLQILFNSITANRDSWSAQGGTSIGFPAYQPANYSYVLFMNNLGYPTLALDRLGTGQSDHPDPIIKCQGPYEDALYHDLVTKIKAGTTKQLPRVFTKLIYVGNSYGSELGTTSALKFPHDFAAYILTGFSKSVDPSLPGVSLQAPEPAAISDPARFGNLAAGYLTSSNEPTRTNSFFGSPEFVDFDPENAHLFFTRRDVVSVGQFITTYIGPVMAPQYTGRVLVLTGEQDQAFCGPGSSALNPDPSCGTLLAQTKSLFPSADYNYQSINKTGHAIQLFRSAHKTYTVAALFLAGASFAGGPI